MNQYEDKPDIKPILAMGSRTLISDRLPITQHRSDSKDHLLFDAEHDYRPDATREWGLELAEWSSRIESRYTQWDD